MISCLQSSALVFIFCTVISNAFALSENELPAGIDEDSLPLISKQCVLSTDSDSLTQEMSQSSLENEWEDSTLQTPWQNPDYTESLSSNPGRKERTNTAIKLAKQYTYEAYNSDWAKKSKNARMRTLFKLVWNRLQDVFVAYPSPGLEFSVCKQKSETLGFNSPGSIRIYLCARTFQRPEMNSKYLAQIIIHETMHSLGYPNECEATGVEVSIMRLSVGLTHKNGYFYECGFR